MTSLFSNLLTDIPDELPVEHFQTLVATTGIRIERIVSHGHASPGGFWYDQDQDEWVLVLQGAAKLRFEDRLESFDLTPGTHVLIPAHTRHRIDWTDPTQATIWLAVHFATSIEKQSDATGVSSGGSSE